MIKETITVKDARELKKAVKKKYDTILIEGALKNQIVESKDFFEFKKRGKEISSVFCGVGLLTLIFGIGIPILIGGVIGQVVFKNAIVNYEMHYDEETKILKLLYYKK